jgi:hypothetical protein
MTKTNLLPIVPGVTFMAIAIAIFSCAEAIAADWKSLGSDDDFSYFYDSTTISYPSKAIARVWTKTIYKEKGRVKSLERFRDNKELSGIIKNLDHTLNLFEINCLDKKFRTLSGIFYSKNGKVLKTVESTSGPWKFIPPDTMYEAIYDLVCK